MHLLFFNGDLRGTRDAAILIVERRGSSATYFSREEPTVTETSVSAVFGKVASIDVHFVPGGKERIERSACDPEPISFDSGFYEGRIDFEGEEGFTEAHATRARGEVQLGASLVCGGGFDVEGEGGHAPGARLRVRRHWDGGHWEFEAMKNSPSRPSRFYASISEIRGDMAIEREIRLEAGAGAFDYDVPRQVAKLSPPAPFQGAARFSHPSQGPSSLRGSLSVDFPGHSNVPLRGGHALLRRWVANPSHPFRLQPQQ
jgi:hypothetical protein